MDQLEEHGYAVEENEGVLDIFLEDAAATAISLPQASLGNLGRSLAGWLFCCNQARPNVSRAKLNLEDESCTACPAEKSALVPWA